MLVFSCKCTSPVAHPPKLHSQQVSLSGLPLSIEKPELQTGDYAVVIGRLLQAEDGTSHANGAGSRSVKANKVMASRGHVPAGQLSACFIPPGCKRGNADAWRGSGLLAQSRHRLVATRVCADLALWMAVDCT